MKNASIFRVAGVLVAAALLMLAPVLSVAQEHGNSDQPYDIAAVGIDGVTLFKVRGATSFPAVKRAAGIAERIKEVAEDHSVDPASIHLVPEGDNLEIMAGTTRIMVVVLADAQAEQLRLDDLAKLILTRVRQGIADYRAVRTPERKIRGTLLAAGGTVLAVVLAGLLLWLTRRLRLRVERVMRERVQTVSIQSFKILRSERMLDFVVGLLRTLSVVGLVGLTLFWLIFVLKQFPLTRGVGTSLLRDVLTPLATLGDAFLDSIPNLVFLVILYYVVRGALRMIRAFFIAVEREAVSLSGFEPEWGLPTYKLVRVAVVALSLIVAYPYIPGSDSDAFKGVSLFAGIVFSLGSSSAIANIIAGYMMTYRRAFRVGDRVKIGDVMGDVTEMRLQVTHLRTPKNEEVVIPNSQIINGHVTNYSTLAEDKGLLLHTTVGIGYETPWRQVEAMLLEAAARTEGLAPKPESFVLQTALGDFAITYEINVACGDPYRMGRIYTALHRNILDVFNEYGVAIMTPAYEGDPPDAKLVPKEKWFLPPAKPDQA